MAIANPFAWPLPVWLASERIDGFFLLGGRIPPLQIKQSSWVMIRVVTLHEDHLRLDEPSRPNCWARHSSPLHMYEPRRTLQNTKSDNARALAIFNLGVVGLARVPVRPVNPEVWRHPLQIRPQSSKSVEALAAVVPCLSRSA